MTQIMGILNITPDSFSDGGEYFDPEAAVRHAHELVQAGASIIDIGGESTGPGSQRVDPGEEQKRILETVREVSQFVTVSVDTLHAETARGAAEAGASIINDVSGGLYDARMLETVAHLDVDYVIGHWRGIPDPKHSRSVYDNVVEDVAKALERRVEEAIVAGVRAERIIVDPGLGFDKTAQQSWELVRGVERLEKIAPRVLVGASRKRMVAEHCRETPLGVAPLAGSAPARETLDEVTAYISLFCALQEVWAVRVHSVEHSFRAIRAAQKLAPSSVLCLGSAASAASAEAQRPKATAPAAANSRVQINIEGLRIYAHHGVYAHEQEQGQEFIIDLTCSYKRAAAVDSIEHALDYASLTTEVVSLTKTPQSQLIETVAERIADHVIAKKEVAHVRVTVKKPQAPLQEQLDCVSVTVERFQQELQK